MATEMWVNIVQVMAYCLTAPSHYLKQSCLLISKVLWHSPVKNFTVIVHAGILYIQFKTYTYKIIATSPTCQ